MSRIVSALESRSIDQLKSEIMDFAVAQLCKTIITEHPELSGEEKSSVFHQTLHKMPVLDKMLMDRYVNEGVRLKTRSLYTKAELQAMEGIEYQE